MKIVSFLLLFALHVSCASNTEPPVIKKIPDDEMVSLLVDLHLADAARGSNELADAVVGKTISDDNAAVLAQHHIKEEDFRTTMTYYSAHPEELAQLYDSVIERLTALQGNAIK